MVITRSTHRSDAPSLASRRSKAGSKITEYNREDYRLIPTPGWPGYFHVGKILAYQLGEKLNESWLYRRGVIIESFASYSTLLPIKTYSGRGCTHLKEEQKVHSAVYVGSRPPFPKQEPFLRVAIQASWLDVENFANLRINYNGRFNLSHTERVREVGQVSRRDLQVLLDQYREVHGIAQEDTAAPSPEPFAPPHAKYVPPMEDPQRLPEDREDSGPQRTRDKNSANLARIQTLDLAAVHSLAETPQTSQRAKTINATAPQIPSKTPAGPSDAPPASSIEELIPPPTVLKESYNDALLQENGTGISKAPVNDVENRLTTPSVAVESSRTAPPMRSPPQPEQSVNPTQDDLSTETLPERMATPTEAVETPLPEGDHLTPVEAICPISDTASEEGTGPVDLLVSQTANTESVSGAVNLNVQDRSQTIGMFELHKEITTPIQETNSAVPDAEKQDMQYTVDYTILPFSLQEMVASLHVLLLTAYTNVRQTMDMNLPQEPEKHATAPSAAAAKSKQHVVGGIPPPSPSRNTPTMLLLPLLLAIRAILQFCTFPNSRENRCRHTRPPAPTPPHPPLGDEPDQAYGGYQHHTTAENDPPYAYYQHGHAINEQSIYPSVSSDADATRPYTSSPPMSPYHRSIWLQDEGFKSKIKAIALVDTGADDNFISEQAVQRLDAKVYPYRGYVTYGNGQKQAIIGSVRLHFRLNSQTNRYHDQFIVVAGLPYSVVFGRDLNDRLKFLLPNKEMLILTHTKNGNPTEEEVREAERQAKEHDRQVKEQNEREREETRARRALGQHQKRA